MSVLTSILGGLDTRLKRLEELIGDPTEAILNFLAVKEEIGVADTVIITKRVVNTTFLVGHGKVGITNLGDRRSASVTLYSGSGS